MRLATAIGAARPRSTATLTERVERARRATLTERAERAELVHIASLRRGLSPRIGVVR